MTSTRPCLASLILLVTLSTAMADGAKRTTTTNVTTKSDRTERRVVTGSLIPERTAPGIRHANMTRSTGPVIILTSADIQRIGARDLADALSRGIAIGR